MTSLLLGATTTPDELSFRLATVADLDTCLAIESASYPPDEAASKESLQYRQEHAGDYFQVAVLLNDTTEEQIVGFICATRCNEFTEESMSTHVEDESAPYLAIHSVVVQEEYRRRGIATLMLQHCLQQQEQHDNDVTSVVLLAKSHLLGFYVKSGGFTVVRPSPIVHGKDLWFELEKVMMQKTVPHKDESWFVKTETFCKPFPQVQPHLLAHSKWVQMLRQEQGVCITSGYRVDAEGKPGGGGLMFLAAKNYKEARALVLQDPLVANECVDWQLNGWIGQVGDIQMR